MNHRLLKSNSSPSNHIKDEYGTPRAYRTDAHVIIQSDPMALDVTEGV